MATRDVFWTSEFNEVNITSINIFDGEVIFVGNGNSIEQYNFKTGEKLSLFFDCALSQGVTIHGIKRFSSKYIVFGGRELRVINPNGISVLSLKINDWIIDVVQIKNDIIILTMTNCLIRISIGNFSSSNHQIFHSTEKCSLYSGLILVQEDNSVLVFAGTAFKEILIWNCDFKNDSSHYPLVQKLLGHDGVIFSLAQSNNTYLVSTSDDRTARLWKSKDAWKNTELVSVLDGAHTSRIFRSVIEGDYVILGGEDGFISIWNKENGEFLRRYEGSSASVWGLDVFQDKVVASSGVSINMWMLNFENNYKVEVLELATDLGSDYVKELICVPGTNDLVCLTQCGTVKLNDMTLYKDDSLESYGLLSVNGYTLYICNLHGDLFVFNLISKELERKTKLVEGKIFSLEALNYGRVLLCSSNGLISIFDRSLERVSEFYIPVKNIKQWWVTCASSINEDRYMIGNRDGTLFLANKVVLSSLYRVHGKQGVGDIQYEDEKIRSIGRDGTMRIFIVKDDDLIPLNVIKLNYSWMEKIVSSPRRGLLLLGFYSKDFIVYDPEHEKIIYQVPCGGCHRSWDFRFDHESFGVFTYVKDKVVHQVVLLNILNEMVIKPIFHTKEINALKVVAFENSQYLLTGGEDTKLLLRNLKNNRITSNLKSHISNIRCLDAILDGDSMILASGGGRAELKLWRMFPDQNIILLSSFLMKGNDKRRKKVWRDTKLIPDVETRITSVTLWKKNDSLTFIVIACSDGLLRLLQYDANFSKLQIIKESAEGPSCFLVVKTLLCNGQKFVVSGSTKGDLQVWKIEDDYSFRAISQVIAHQSGINAIDILGHFIVTGGDDGAIAQFEFRNGCLTEINRINDAHESQITGVKYMDQFILSCGVDQKFITWRSSDFSFYSQEISSVADVKGIEVFKDKVFIVGEGVQYFKLIRGQG
ncbi:uncharacterized protein [Lepeophtheirus salmonis]|uniref:uncharacterized protein n=1 Tax=Lepeophtheirus salmonis TaxID=72036 RepID=UPI001AE84D36|nr:uncharacterized WD repeat-containing protein C1306.02-like [Lepeophtheirus salmonis]